MFTSKEEKENTTTTYTAEKMADTVIGSTVSVEGNLECHDSIHIDGKFSGTIETSKEITIGADAIVEGRVKASTLFISGLLRGNITATDSVELMSTARVYGDIESETISIQKGAVLQGECMTGKKMSTEKEDDSSQTE